jgi:hypothetical protein
MNRPNRLPLDAGQKIRKRSDLAPERPSNKGRAFSTL